MEFHRLFERLPASIRALADVAFERFCDNPAYPSLRLHRLKDNDKGRHRNGSFSVSINRQYRALYVEVEDANVWYWIGSHADYDAFTGGK